MKTRTLLLLFLTINFIYAKEKTVDSLEQNYLKHGLLFAIEPTIISTIYSFTSSEPIKGYLGALISGRYRYSERGFFRYGLSLSGGYRNSTTYDTNIVIDSQYSDYELKTTNISASINLERLKYITSHLKVCPYFGPGIYIGGNYSKSYNIDKNNSQLEQTHEISSKSYGVGAGLRALFGCEWIISPNFSLFLEYKASLGYNYTKTKIKELYTSQMKRKTQKAHDINFSPASIRLGLCVNFKLKK